MRIAVERCGLRMNGTRRPVTIPSELAELAPARPTQALLGSLTMNPILLEIFAAAQPRADSGRQMGLAGW
jgi:hypothetical protein